MWVRGNSRSFKLVPLKSLSVVSYSPSVVTMALSVAVCEIFSIKEWCDLENRVRVCSRSSEMAPFDRSHAWCRFLLAFYSNWRCLVLFARYSDLLVKTREIFITHIFLAPPQGVTLRMLRRCLILVKLKWLGYWVVKKLWQYVELFSWNTGTWRMDRQTDGPTELLYQYHALAY